ncbi:MAG: phosphoenolpyruvate synthase [Chlamydiae bacterium RIFCSPLOWO2_12_FULL_49_12]|nr:MAG: phosphoenolpyruvate synthase [Chlamydiae bacterium GWF2_49_8]OGN57335.1 MAG: phosphoenolpyruvate synthase [Chlamydiae bacterium RIFCSPHIGHO2_02_FULL_49_29]OGN70785.1 MAG: phosphoenolpyruvate synthase [Chlamydiae bacterium RIFCSPLOWO2_12_FULL_49_12]
MIRWFETLSKNDVPLVGGKNASLGEMISSLKGEGIRIPDGFAVTADAYWSLVEAARIKDKIQEELLNLKKNPDRLSEVGAAIRECFLKATLSDAFKKEIGEAYRALSKRYRQQKTDVAVRSSATAEDLPEASFAGQQESYLNVQGEEALFEACLKCYASLFTDRAISYREAKGFDHLKIALSIGIQKMVRSDLASSGVMFSLHTESGFPKVVVINAIFGLGENIVQGAVTPDEYILFKPLLDRANCLPLIEKVLGEKSLKMVYAKGGVKNKKTPKAQRLRFVLLDDEILTLARWAVKIEQHYGMPMDMEWAKDGKSNELFLVQARPETVHSRKNLAALKSFTLLERGNILTEGLAIGEAIASGRARVVLRAEDVKSFEKGSILVTEITSPDWVPLMRKAGGIITDHGGRTSHAAIVSRELGIPAVVGTGNATKAIPDGGEITLSCAEGDRGVIYQGKLRFEEKELDLSAVPATKTQLMINISGPAEALRWWTLPCRGVGLARMEFIINNNIKIHPMALIHPERIEQKKERRLIEKLTKGYAKMSDYFVAHLSQGIGMIAASRYPDPVIVRMSDFKTNEYANLIGGKAFEPKEENPMLGLRGASRYYNDLYREGFALECRALLEVREKMGLDNVIPMIPFCRTLEEADRVLSVMEEMGLKRGVKGLQIYVMCEIPSNIILAEEFASRFDGFSIGSNDLTQLTLGVDRDSSELAPLFDERNEAVKKSIRDLIRRAHGKGCKVGICGQAPSDYPDFAAFLVELGIDSISLNPDSLISVTFSVAELEKKTLQ